MISQDIPNKNNQTNSRYSKSIYDLRETCQYEIQITNIYIKNQSTTNNPLTTNIQINIQRKGRYVN